MLTAAVTAAGMAVLGIASPAVAQPKPPSNYFEIDFTAAEPTSYNHLYGGGAYDRGISNLDTVQSLEGTQFTCGDIVSFMTKVKMNDAEGGLYGATTVRLSYEFAMATTGSATGVGFADLIDVNMNYAPITDLLEPGSTVDDAIIDDGGSTTTVHDVTKVGSLWVSGSHLDAQVDLSDVEAGETVVLHLNLKIKCDPSQSTATGNVQAKLARAEVVAVTNNPTNTTLPDYINSGIRTIPLKSPGGIHYPQVSIQKTVALAGGTCPTTNDIVAINSGDQVKFCFAITNPSNVLNPPGAPLYQLRVKDDNGTPSDPADDFWLDTATITGLQDLDGNGQLNDLGPGVTAYASVTRSVIGDSGATIVNTATAYGDDSVIDPYTLSDTDTAQAVIFVPAPAVAIAKTTSNTVDPLPSDDPIMFIGDTVHWFYEVTNTGNVPLNTISVTDNRGVTVTCPSTTLAVGNAMTCTADGTAIAGTYTNIGTVVAHYNSDTVTASDGSGYFGRNPQISVTKSPATQTVIQGETATFTITVTNSGNVPLTSVVITDPLAPACSTDIGALAVGETATVNCDRSGVTTPFTNVVSATGNYGVLTVTDTASATVNVDFLPDIAVSKTASPTAIAETGGNVVFTIVVTNNGVENFTLNTLTDSVYGNLAGQGTCVVPQTITAAGTYTCSFNATLSGEPTTTHTDTVTASGIDPQGHPDSASDDAVVTFSDVLPDITVTKTANPTHVSELGGPVVFTVVVTNVNSESVILNSLSDSSFGNLAGKGTCATGGSIAGSGGTYSCTFTETMTGQPAVAHQNTVTAVASDNDGNSDTATATANVSFDDVLPDITVTKTANPTHVSEVGGAVTFTVVVTNVNAEAVTLGTLSDNVFGNLAGKGTCATGGSIAGSGGTYSCTFTETITGEPAAPHSDTVTAIASDDDGNSDTAYATALVTLDDVLPDITVTKTANPTHVSELGGSVTFTVVVTNVNAEAVTLGSLTDNVFGNLAGKGTCATGGSIAGSGGTYSCTFTETITGEPAAPHTDTVTAIASDNDGNSDTATASAIVTFDDVLPDISVTKTANPTHVSELGGPVTFTVVVTNANGEAVTLASLVDSVFGNLAGKGTCATGGSIAGSGGTYSCSFTETLTGQPATPHSDTVTAVASDNDGNSDTATASATVNFDDVLPDITVTKTANPTHVSELGGSVAFTVVVTNVNAEAVTLNSLVDSVFGNLAGKGTCTTGGSITGSGGTYTCTFTETVTGQPAAPHIDTVTAVAADNDGNSDTATASATVTFDDVLPDITVTKTANPTHVSELGGPVTFTVVVTNVNAEAVTLSSLQDSVFGNLAGKGSCATGGTINGGSSYNCSFTMPLSGQPATPHTDTVTAVAADNDGNSDTATASAMVTFDNVPPTITVTKTANPTTLPISGGYVDYTIRITNAGAETVTVTALTDTRFTLPETCTSIVIGHVLAPGTSIDCLLSQQWIVPDANGKFINSATSTGCDDDGTCDTETGTATVQFAWYGRTPGYWKNHPAAWPGSYLPTTPLSSVFALPSSITSGSGKPQVGDTLMVALSYQGGSTVKGAAQILLRAATAAVLNEAYYGNWYPAASIPSIVDAVNAALASGNRSNMLTLATKLDSWNNGIETPLP